MEHIPSKRPNPLVRRTLAAGAMGMAITVGTLFGAGSALSEPLVVTEPIAVVDAIAGQEIVVEPATMAQHLHTAVLLAMPFAYAEAEEAAEAFAAQPPISLGTVESGTTSFSGGEVAEAAKPRLEQLGLPPEELESVYTHFEAALGFGSSVTVRAEDAPAPPPEPSPVPQPEPEPVPVPTPTTVPPPPAETPAVEAPAPAVSAAPQAAPTFTPPPIDYSVLQATPPWSTAQFSRAHTVVARDTQLTENSAPLEERDQAQAVGKAEVVPMTDERRDVLPILLAAISIAAVIAAVIRGWVLRRG